MLSMVAGSVKVQSSAQSEPALPCWFGEVALIVTYLRKLGLLEKIPEQVRFARRRFGQYEVIDFVAVLIGYVISGERTLQEYYAHLQPFAPTFMALFDRESLPSRSALSRFLAALSWTAVESLRSLFLTDGLARSWETEENRGQLVDRQGKFWTVFDIDGTREAARQRALPQGADLPVAQRRMSEVCAPGYLGRKRGEGVRTRTVVCEAHTFLWLGSFGHRGNGQYREELGRAVDGVDAYLQACGRDRSQALIRLDGLYGNAAVLASLSGRCFVVRGKDYAVLDQDTVQIRLHLPPDGQFSRPESPLVRELYDCPNVVLGEAGIQCRVIVATHPAGKKKSPIGKTREGVVYELFFTQLPQEGLTAADVVALYLHRGAFEPLLADEDAELDTDRWCSHSPAGQETFQILAQWVWNLRLELGHHLTNAPVRTTEFAPAIPPAPSDPPAQGYGPAEVAGGWKAGRFTGPDFVPQADGTLLCPAQQVLHAHEQRPEADGGLRIVYGASIKTCRGCNLRKQCQWNGQQTKKPRQVSVLLHPLAVGSGPVLWQDWSRRAERRACQQLVVHQRLDMVVASPPAQKARGSPTILTRAERVHSRLSWAKRAERNARSTQAAPLSLQLYGVPDVFACTLGLAVT